MYKILSVESIILAIICVLLVLLAYFTYRLIKKKSKSNLIVIIALLVLSTTLSGFLLFRSFSSKTDVITGKVSGTPEYINSHKFNFAEHWKDTSKKISVQSDKNVNNLTFARMILKFKLNENSYENSLYQLELADEQGENVADIFSIKDNDISYSIRNNSCHQQKNINAAEIMLKLDNINLLNFITQNIDTGPENEINVVVDLDNQNSIKVEPDNNIYTVINEKIVKLQEPLIINNYYLRVFINNKYNIYFNVL